jgi:hypothetical protein
MWAMRSIVQVIVGNPGFRVIHMNGMSTAMFVRLF